MLSFKNAIWYIVLFSLAPVALPSGGQQAPAPAQPRTLALTAAIVLTPEFCASVKEKGHEKFAVGKSACAQLEPILKPVFQRLLSTDDPAKSGNAQIVLEPKFSDIGATQRAFAFSDRELVVLVEWTVRDQSGKVLWLDTVEGHAKRHNGNLYTYRSNLKHIVEDSVKDMAEQSAAKISTAPSLAKLSAAPVK